MQPARQQHMARLAAEERHRLRRLHRDAHHRAGRAVDAARQVDGDHRNAAPIHRLDHDPRQPLDRTIEPGAKQRVDDDVAILQRVRRRRRHRPAPALEGGARIALEPLGVADEHDPHIAAALGQQARRDETVAAIVARPGDDHDAVTARQGRRRIGDRAAGVFHQGQPRRAAGNRQPVGLGHLKRCQEFVHANDTIGREYDRQIGGCA